MKILHLFIDSLEKVIILKVILHSGKKNGKERVMDKI